MADTAGEFLFLFAVGAWEIFAVLNIATLSKSDEPFSVLGS
jgi:hypothetical protein